MPKPEPPDSNPLIQRAREALGSRSDKRDDEEAPPGDPAAQQGQRSPTPSGRPPSELRRTVTEAGHKIQEIVDAAERVAEEIEAEARAEADRYLGDRVRDADRLYEERAGELGDVTSGLVDRAEALRVEAEALAAEVARTVERLRPSGRASAASAAPRSVPEAPAPEREDKPAAPEFKPRDDEVAPNVSSPRPVAYPGTGGEADRAADSEPGDVPEEALLRATQMAVAGNSRDEIEATLRSEYGVDDPGAVTDEILGPG